MDGRSLARSDRILKQGSTPGKTNKSADSKYPILLVLVEWLTRLLNTGRGDPGAGSNPAD